MRFLRAPELLTLVILLATAASAQQRSELRVHLVIPGQAKGAQIPAVVWLKPINGTPDLPFVPQRRYRLLQKNRMFTPHLLVIPVGSTVDFPNADPFFHNVFSLFDGKRFDLGLYEAGSDKQVVFSREGVSYIFCNIHPEMSAVVLALTTPLYAVADQGESAVVHGVPQGDYQLVVWVEGVPQSTLTPLTRTVQIATPDVDLGNITIPIAPIKGHTNKFGDAYDAHPKNPY
jgi:hypothetical protein